RRAASQMQSLIESLLLLAREDEVRGRAERTDVKSVVLEQVDLLADLARETGNAVRIVDDGAPTVQAPARMVAIVFGNLLRNALAYCRDGVVTVTLRPDGVAVRDTGVGMTQADRERIFEPFFRGHAAQSQPTDGHGLGLAIVRRLVDQFGWSLDVVSAPGVGTTVTLAFGAAHGARMRNPTPGSVSISS
ncbi:MAG TPA: HAMP domain-containing sensor histidine kinase, partial [Pseudomonadales bacterium]|nr:HAMP domain-containing sensor histidine kinase [Pseudomonadales bacterium]